MILLDYIYLVMKTVRKIISVLLTLIFLIPAAGLYYVKNTCLHKGNQKIALSDKYECCGPEKEDQNCCRKNEMAPLGSNDQSSSIHSIMKNHQGCCINKVNYLKDGTHYRDPAISIIKIYVFNTAFFPSAAELLLITMIHNRPEFIIPNNLSSSEILQQTCKLTI